MLVRALSIRHPDLKQRAKAITNLDQIYRGIYLHVRVEYEVFANIHVWMCDMLQKTYSTANKIYLTSLISKIVLRVYYLHISSPCLSKSACNLFFFVEWSKNKHIRCFMSREDCHYYRSSRADKNSLHPHVYQVWGCECY